MYFKKKQFERALVTAVDLICVICSVLIALKVRYQVLPDDNLAFILVLFAGMYLLANLFMDPREDLISRGHFAELLQIVKLHIIILALMSAYLYMNKKSTEVSRLVFGFFNVADLSLMFLVRTLLKRYLCRHYKQGRSSRRLLLVTDSGQVDKVVEVLKHKLDWDIRLAGVVVADRSLTGTYVSEIPVVADMQTLIEYVRMNPVDEVFIRIDRQVQISMKRLITELGSMGITVDLSIRVVELDIASEKSLNQLADYQVVTFSRKIMDYNQLLMKRTLDVVGGVVGMAVFGIAFLFVAPIIKLDSPGPVLFKQTRVGKNGRVFQIYKFRSMYVDAEERKKELMKYNEMNGLMFKMEDDPRITRAGRFIRKTSIDELPQFWNVLKGDMSLVGTRPPTLDEFERYKPEYKSRLILSPGLTGLWQTSGRSSITDFSEVMKLDMSYIDHWSFLGDIKIILKTVKVVLLGDGAR